MAHLICGIDLGAGLIAQDAEGQPGGADTNPHFALARFGNRNIPLHRESRARHLITEGRRVIGIETEEDGKVLRIKARKGVKMEDPNEALKKLFALYNSFGITSISDRSSIATKPNLRLGHFNLALVAEQLLGALEVGRVGGGLGAQVAELEVMGVRNARRAPLGRGQAA